MLWRSTHMVYITTVLLLLAALLLRPTAPHPASVSAEPPQPGAVVPRGLQEADAPPHDAAPHEAAADALVRLDQNLDQQVPPATGRDRQRSTPPPTGAPATSLDFNDAECIDPETRAPGVKLTPELITRCIDVARDIDLEMGDRLAKLRERDPTAFVQSLKHESGRRLLAMAQLQERDPELYKLKLSEVVQNVQVQKLAAQLRKAVREENFDEIDPLKEQLRTVLGLQLALSIRSRVEALCKLEEQVTKLKEEIDHEARFFSETVEARVQELLRDDGPIEAAEVMPHPTATSAPEPNQN